MADGIPKNLKLSICGIANMLERCRLSSVDGGGWSLVCDRISVAHNAGLLLASVLVVHQLALNVAGWRFDPFSFHKAFVLCVGLLSLVEVVCGRYGRGRYRRNSSSASSAAAAELA